jgi:L-fuconolactonase
VRGEPFTVAGIRPAWDAALELFGPDRLLWGSDWPMTLLTAGYAGTWEVMAELVGELTPEEQNEILADTAQRVYGLATPTTSREAPCSPASTRS